MKLTKKEMEKLGFIFCQEDGDKWWEHKKYSLYYELIPETGTIFSDLYQCGVDKGVDKQKSRMRDILGLK